MREKIFNKGQNFPKFCEKHKLTYSRSSTNSKQDNYKETHTQTHHNRRDENTKMKSQSEGSQSEVTLYAVKK